MLGVYGDWRLAGWVELPRVPPKQNGEAPRCAARCLSVGSGQHEPSSARAHMNHESRNGESTPEAVVRRLIDEGFSQGRLEVCDELISDKIVEHQDYGPDHASGPAGVKGVVTSLRRAFSDFTL